MTLSIFMIAGGSSWSANQTTANPASASTVPKPVTNESPANLVLTLTQGQPLINSIVQCLSLAYPQYSIQGAVDPSLVWTKSTSVSYFARTQQLAEFVHEKSLSVIGGYAPNRADYPGVSISLQNNTFTISDQTTQLAPKQISYLDIVGQPTWSQPYQVQVMTVMRGDLQVGDVVTLPYGPLTTTFGAASQYTPAPVLGNGYAQQKNALAFAGMFYIAAIRHVGNSRQPDAAAWVTTLDLLSLPQNTPLATGAALLPVLYAPN